MNIAIRRFLSWIIDMVIIFFILFIIQPLFPVNQYEIEFTNINEQYFEKRIDSKEYMTKYMDTIHHIDKGNLAKNIIMTILLIITFIIVPFLNKGQTVGQKILQLKTVRKDKKDIQIEDLVFRSVIINGLGYMLFMFTILYLVPNNIYFLLISLFGFFQIIVAIISSFMILYKKDHEGLQDFFTNTQVERSLL